MIRAAAQPAVNTHARTHARTHAHKHKRVSPSFRVSPSAHAHTHDACTHAHGSLAEQRDARGQGHGRIYFKLWPESETNMR